MSEHDDIDHIDEDLEKAWPREYTRVKGQDKNKGVSSKSQYALMQAAAAGKVEGISAEDAKAYLKNSPKGGESLPDRGTGGARGERERSRSARKADKRDKVDKADAAEQIKDKYRDKSISEEEKIKQIKEQNKPKVITFSEQIKNIKEKYKEKKPREFKTQISDIKAKYKPINKSRDLFYAKIEGSLSKNSANEQLISNMMDMDAYILTDDESRMQLYKTADRYFDAVLSKEEQVVYELSYLAKNGCEDSHDLLVKFLDSMYEELVKHSSIDDVISSSISSSLEKSKKHKDKIKGGLADKKDPKDFNEKQLKAGIKVEYEHTNDKDLAREIAMDHLTEDPDYYKKLEVMEEGGYDDEVEKSNYGPKGMNLYNETDNVNRKSRRVGTVHENVGQNKSEYKYTPSARGTFAEQSSREAKRDKSLSAKNPVKVYTDEEKKKLQEEYDKKLASEDNSRVKGKINGESYRIVHGYKRYTSGAKRGQYVHRHEAEKRLGRKLSSNEEVHHKDGNRSSTSNTKVSSKSDHTAETNKKRSNSKNGYSGSHKYEHSGSH